MPGWRQSTPDRGVLQPRKRGESGRDWEAILKVAIAVSPSLTGLHVESDEGDGHHGGKDAAHGLARHDVPRVRRREAAGNAEKRTLR